MNENCIKCGSENCYFDGTLNICPDCFYEWNESTETSLHEADEFILTDSNGTQLFDGDSVTIIKDLPVKGSSMVIKRGTKVKSIKITDDTEHVDCRINGSTIAVKTMFLKKQ